MTLGDFGAGVPPEKQSGKVAHSSRSERAQHRRNTYRLGRCRAISTSKGCRCGGAVIEDTDGEFCHYHGQSHDPTTIDSSPELLARWCGCKATVWEEISAPCRKALNELKTIHND